jgi:hypothetical protein
MSGRHDGQSPDYPQKSYPFLDRGRCDITSGSQQLLWRWLSHFLRLHGRFRFMILSLIFHFYLFNDDHKTVIY